MWPRRSKDYELVNNDQVSEQENDVDSVAVTKDSHSRSEKCATTM